MAQRKSDLLTFGRRLHDIGRVVVEAVHDAGGNDEDAERIFGDDLLGQIGQLVMGKLKLAKPVGFPVTYDQSLGLRKLIELAVGPDNLGNINSDITSERFKLAGTGGRKVMCRVEPFLDGETSEQAALRLTAKGCIRGNTGDLAGFFHDHPKEVEKWKWVLAISEDSRWARSGDYVSVPCAYVSGAGRSFDLSSFRLQLCSSFGVLVLCE